MLHLYHHQSMQHLCHHKSMMHLCHHQFMMHLCYHQSMMHLCHHQSMLHICQHQSMLHLCHHQSMMHLCHHPSMVYLFHHQSMVHLSHHQFSHTYPKTDSYHVNTYSTPKTAQRPTLTPQRGIGMTPVFFYVSHFYVLVFRGPHANHVEWNPYRKKQCRAATWEALALEGWTIGWRHQQQQQQPPNSCKGAVLEDTNKNIYETPIAKNNAG